MEMIGSGGTLFISGTAAVGNVTFIAADVTPGGHHQRSPAAGSPLQRSCLFGLKLFNVMETSV